MPHRSNAASYELAFSRSGAGPSVVLLHGLGSNRQSWEPETRRLCDRYTVLTIDLPGHGDSPAVPTLDLDRLASSIAELIRGQALVPAVLVGHSLGGTVAAWTAHALGHDACGLVIVDSSIASMRTPKDARAGFRVAMAQDHDGALRRVHGPSFGSPAQLERFIAEARPVTADTYVGYLDALAANDVSPRNPELQVPVHAMMSPLLVSRLDRAALDAFGFSGVRELTWTGFPASRHYLFWDEPERFAEDLDAALARFGSRAAQ